jgi:hypothetical protein
MPIVPLVGWLTTLALVEVGALTATAPAVTRAGIREPTGIA